MILYLEISKCSRMISPYKYIYLDVLSYLHFLAIPSMVTPPETGLNCFIDLLSNDLVYFNFFPEAACM